MLRIPDLCQLGMYSGCLSSLQWPPPTTFLHSKTSKGLESREIVLLHMDTTNLSDGGKKKMYSSPIYVAGVVVRILGFKLDAPLLEKRLVVHRLIFNERHVAVEVISASCGLVSFFEWQSQALGRFGENTMMEMDEETNLFSLQKGYATQDVGVMVEFKLGRLCDALMSTRSGTNECLEALSGEAEIVYFSQYILIFSKQLLVDGSNIITSSKEDYQFGIFFGVVDTQSRDSAAIEDYVYRQDSYLEGKLNVALANDISWSAVGITFEVVTKGSTGLAAVQQCWQIATDVSMWCFDPGKYIGSCNSVKAFSAWLSHMGLWQHSSWTSEGQVMFPWWLAKYIRYVDHSAADEHWEESMPTLILLFPLMCTSMSQGSYGSFGRIGYATHT